MADAFKKFEDDILEKEVHHDENVIDDKRSAVKEHEVQMDEEDSKIMKDLRASEIKHDEKVIVRKEDKAAEHEEKIKKNEQEIHNVK